MGSMNPYLPSHVKIFRPSNTDPPFFYSFFHSIFQFLPFFLQSFSFLFIPFPFPYFLVWVLHTVLYCTFPSSPHDSLTLELLLENYGSSLLEQSQINLLSIIKTAFLAFSFQL